MKEKGRLFYIGAGSSGRLGVLDAAECPPTFNTDPGMVQAVIAGGPEAVFAAGRGSRRQGRLAGPTSCAGAKWERMIALVGIAASGVTPFVLGGLKRSAGPRGLHGPADLRSPGTGSSRRGCQHRPTGRPRGGYRIDAAESGNRNQDGPQHDLHGCNDPAGEDTGQPDGRPATRERQAAGPVVANPSDDDRQHEGGIRSGFFALREET